MSKIEKQKANKQKNTRTQDAEQHLTQWVELLLVKPASHIAATPVQLLIPANVLRKRAGDNPSAWAPVTGGVVGSKRDQYKVTSSWLQPDPVLAVNSHLGSKSMDGINLSSPSLMLFQPSK